MAEYPWASATIPYLDTMYARMNDNDKTRREVYSEEWMDEDQDTDADKENIDFHLSIGHSLELSNEQRWQSTTASYSYFYQRSKAGQFIPSSFLMRKINSYLVLSQQPK